MNFDPSLWNRDFIHTSPIFNPIKPAYNASACNIAKWPTLDDCNASFSNETNKLFNNNQKQIRFVEQSLDKKPPFTMQYEPRVYLTGEVQTRLNNWHDFLQVLVWKTWPKTKSLINELHYQSSSKRTENKRSNVENFLTLFDECGIVIISSNATLLDYIINFQWKSLFVGNRERFNREIRCITCGHAMYEKALNPYIGMTAQALLIQVTEDFFSTEASSQKIDEMIVDNITSKDSLFPKLLHPFPLLGVPGWHKKQDECFYNNSDYFRPGRMKNSTTMH